MREFIKSLEIGNNELFDNQELFEKLKTFQEKFEIHFIEANRIFTSKVMDTIRGRERMTQVDSIRIYSQELKSIIDLQKKEKERVSEQ